MEDSLARRSFEVTQEDMKVFRQKLDMMDQEGIYLVYKTDPKAVAKVLPPPLEVTEHPLVFLSISHIKNPTFADPYYETILSVLGSYKGEVSAYPVSLLLGGFGSEMATYFGREFGSMPKKLGAEFNLRRNGDHVTAQVSRRGTQILDLTMKLGDYNVPEAGAILGSPAPGKERKSTSYFFYLDKMAGVYKEEHKDQSALIQSRSTMVYKTWEPGEIDLKITSSLDDPWGELPVVQMLGGGYSENDLLLNGGTWLEALKAEDIMPKLLYAWYDKTVFEQLGRR